MKGTGFLIALILCACTTSSGDTDTDIGFDTDHILIEDSDVVETAPESTTNGNVEQDDPMMPVSDPDSGEGSEESVGIPTGLKQRIINRNRLQATNTDNTPRSNTNEGSSSSSLKYSSSCTLRQKFNQRPKADESWWIRGRNPLQKLNLIAWLIDGIDISECLSTESLEHEINELNATKECAQKVSDCIDQEEEPAEVQSFDGFFNNIFKTDLGAVDTPLLRRLPPVYDDGVYLPVTKGRINPFNASRLMERTKSMTECEDVLVENTSPCGSRTGKTAFLVFFGQQVVEEILDAQRPGCPPEYFNVDIPKEHRFHEQSPKKSSMPFLRSRYSQTTGQSPGNPRQQLNEITPWFDGGLVYGTAKGWADVLRTNEKGELQPDGKLASEEGRGLFPVNNTLRLPLANPPPPARHCKWIEQHETANVNRFFGNPRGNENAFLLTFGIVLFRWHNHIAEYLRFTRPDWSGERVFNEARKWVIATYQQIVYYDWLPKWLGEDIGPYKGYDPSVDPQVEQFFQTAAMRFGHTLVPPGGYMRDYACRDCSQIHFDDPYPKVDSIHRERREEVHSEKAVRTCNIYWRPQEPLLMRINSSTSSEPDCPVETFHGQEVAGIDRMLMGLASQRAEREDNMIVEDLRGNVFGPLEFSRRDLMAVNIQRGRDHGTPDYNTARESFGLPRICSVQQFMRYTGLYEDYHGDKKGRLKEIQEVIKNLEDLHRDGSHNATEFSDPNSPSCWNNIDVWTGGILETNKHRPGPLFRAIIQDQFSRIRSADRFWFENNKEGQFKPRRFSDRQISRIKQLTVYDMTMSVTFMKAGDIQTNPFELPHEADNEFLCKPQAGKASPFEKSMCFTPTYKDGNITAVVPSRCYQFPQLHTKNRKVDPCTEPGTYDYFSGSEISYIVTFLAIGVTIVGIGLLAPTIATFKRNKKQGVAKLQQKLRQSFRSTGIQGIVFTAREWQGKTEGYRSIVIVLKERDLIEIRSHKGEVLRSVDLSCKQTALDIILVSDGNHLVLKNQLDYDVVFSFEGPLVRESFLSVFKNKISRPANFHEETLKHALAHAVSKTDRLQRLEKFFRVVFAQAFHIDEPMGSKGQEDPKVIREVISTELTRAEFSEALGMRAGSKFVEKMFDLVDRDRSGSINFREFLDMLVIFAKGSAEDKAQLMFEMYDIERTGKLTFDEFAEMIRSLIDASNVDVTTHESTNELIKEMVESAGFSRESQVTLQDFQKLLSEHKDILGYSHLSFSGENVPQAAKAVAEGARSRKSYIQVARATAVSIYDNLEGFDSSAPPPTPGLSKTPLDFGAEGLTTARTERGSSTWFERYRLEIFWVTLYTLVVLCIFAERAYYYSVEREHGGLRHIAGYGVTVTRGAASAMMFCYATVLLPMCRNTVSYLRETFLHRLLPFHFIITLHKYFAIVGLFFSLIHIVGHSINFYHISTQTAMDLACLFRDFFRPTHVLPKFHYWAFQTVTGITGILLVVHGTFLYTFSTNYARTHAFRMFWIVHKTYPLWYILMLIHGSGRLVQEPLFHTFLIGPLVLFILDQLVAVSKKGIEIPVIKADILPSNVTRLEFARPSGFDYKSGQWVRIACSALNSSEFHPFTLSSAPHEPNLTLHIRAVGPFTSFIRQIYEKSPAPLPTLFLDGPYGEGHQDWWRYKVSVLVGGGIGVTPFASILKDVSNNSNPRNCKKIYFLWVTRTQKQFEWLVDIIRDVESHKLISVHLFVTQVYNKFDMRTTLLYICERHFQKVSNRSLFTGLKSITHFGRPDFGTFFRGLRLIHPNVYKFGVFSCGPISMTRRVDEACNSVNNDIESSGTIFQHHVENF